METKLFEVRDAATFIPCIGVLLDEPEFDNERYLMRRAGYSIDTPFVLFGRLDGTDLTIDPHHRSVVPRTMRVAHQHVFDHWDDLYSGDVIDVQFVLGETASPKPSESETWL